jgi:drug/metabolite transporter (DMT)-like permease
MKSALNPASKSWLNSFAICHSIMPAPIQNRGLAVLNSLGAVTLANMQDAIVKGVSTDIPAYETLIYRTVFAFPILFGWLAYSGNIGNMFVSHARELAMRSFVLSTAYIAFILSIAALPLATGVSIYFTMPFFVAGLSAYALGEKVPRYRWVAIAIGFAGVLISVRPGHDTFQPAAFFGLYSAFAYAVAQIWGRRLSHRVPPVVILNWQNFMNFGVACTIALAVYWFGFSSTQDKALSFLTRPWATPTHQQFLLLMSMGVFAAIVATLFLNAYRLAEANFIAPFEYSAIVWATLYGAFIFHDQRDMWDWIGTAIVIGAGLFMLLYERRNTQSTG